MVIICNGGFVIGFIVLWLLHGIINDPIFLGVCVCVNSHWIPVVLKPNLAAPAFLTLPAPLHLQASGDNGQSHGQMSRRGCSCCYFGWLRWYIDVMCIYVCILLIYIYILYNVYTVCRYIYIYCILTCIIYIYIWILCPTLPTWNLLTNASRVWIVQTQSWKNGCINANVIGKYRKYGNIPKLSGGLSYFNMLYRRTGKILYL